MVKQIITHIFIITQALILGTLAAIIGYMLIALFYPQLWTMYCP